MMHDRASLEYACWQVSLSSQGIRTGLGRLILLCLQHCAGIESILVSPEGETLFTASRDATVRSWAGGGAGLGQWRASFKGHCDWVTDAAVVQNQLVTCSSDCCISVWDSQAQGQHL